MLDALVQLVEMLVVLLFAPLLVGYVRKVKALLVGRRGPPLLQPYRDLRRLLRKEVVLAHSASARFEEYPLFHGVSLYGESARRHFMGIVPLTGVLTVPLTIPELGPGVDDRLRHMQALFVDSSGYINHCFL